MCFNITTLKFLNQLVPDILLQCESLISIFTQYAPHFLSTLIRYSASDTQMGRYKAVLCIILIPQRPSVTYCKSQGSRLAFQRIYSQTKLNVKELRKCTPPVISEQLVFNLKYASSYILHYLQFYVTSLALVIYRCRIFCSSTNNIYVLHRDLRTWQRCPRRSSPPRRM